MSNPAEQRRKLRRRRKEEERRKRRRNGTKEGAGRLLLGEKAVHWGVGVAWGGCSACRGLGCGLRGREEIETRGR